MTNSQPDSDNEIQRLIDSMSTEQQTLGERMKDHVVDLFDCKKYSDKKQGQRHTGTAVDISKCEDLCVVDVDINKSLQAEQTKTVRNSILEKLPEMSDLYKQLMVVFTFIVSCLVIPSNVHHKPKCSRVQKIRDLSSLQSVLAIFGIDIKTENTTTTMAAEPHNLLTQDGIVNMSSTVALALVGGLENVEIHNDTDFLSLDSEFTLLLSFAALNSLVNINCFDNQSIDFLYNQIKETAALTANVITHFEEKRYMHRDNKSHPFVLQMIVKRWNPTYYNDVIIPLLRKENEQKEEPPQEITVHEIDLNSSFSFSEIRDKAFRK